MMDEGDTILPPCKVCGEAGTGFHYGVTTCGACKGFFSRSLSRREPYECAQSSLCQIGVGKSRSQCCRKCRYDKCIAVGMSKEACKVGRYTLMKKSKDFEEAIKYRHQTPSYQSPRPTDEEQHDCTQRIASMPTPLSDFGIERDSPHSTFHDNFLNDGTSTQSQSVITFIENGITSSNEAYPGLIPSQRGPQFDSDLLYNDYRQLPSMNTCENDYSITNSSYCITGSERTNESEDFKNNENCALNSMFVSDDNNDTYPCDTVTGQSISCSQISPWIEPTTHQSFPLTLVPTSIATSGTAVPISSNDNINVFPQNVPMITASNDSWDNPIQHYSNTAYNVNGQIFDSEVQHIPHLLHSQLDLSPESMQSPTTSSIITNDELSTSPYPLPLQSDVCVSVQGATPHSQTKSAWSGEGSSSHEFNLEMTPSIIELSDQGVTMELARSYSPTVVSSPSNKRHDERSEECPTSSKKQCVSQTSHDSFRYSTPRRTKTLPPLSLENCLELELLSLNIIQPDPIKSTLSLFESFPFTSYEKQSLAPLLKLCYDANEWVEDYLSDPMTQYERTLSKDYKPNQIDDLSMNQIKPLMSSSSSHSRITSAQEVTYDHLEMENLFNYLQATHCRFYGPESAFLTASEIEKYLELYLKICELYDTLKGSLNLIDDDTYFTLLDRTGIDVDKRKEWFACTFKGFDASFTRDTQFFRALPGFKELSLKDRVVLTQANFPFLISLRHIYTTNRENDISIDQERGVAARISTFKRIFPGSAEFFGQWTYQSYDLELLDLSFEEMIVLKSLFIIRPDSAVDLENPSLVNGWYNTFLKCLLYLLRKLHGPRADDRFNTILEVLQRLKDVECKHTKINGTLTLADVITRLIDKKAESLLMAEVMGYWDTFNIAAERQPKRL